MVSVEERSSNILLVVAQAPPEVPPVSMAPSPPPFLPAPTFLSNFLAHPFYGAIITTSSLTPDIGIQLAATITHQSLVICGDGSYHKSNQSASYGAASAVNGIPLLSLAGPCPGHGSQPSTIRAELCSIMVLLHIINTVRTTYSVSSGSFQLYNDCSKALKYINSPSRMFKCFLVDDYDLLNEIHVLIADLHQCISPCLLWVKGHYSSQKESCNMI
jgi:hypothetical protein